MRSKTGIFTVYFGKFLVYFGKFLVYFGKFLVYFGKFYPIGGTDNQVVTNYQYLSILSNIEK